MQSVKSRNTSLERKLRELLISNGICGFTENRNDIIGRPDFVFEDKKIVIFVNGCFWHGCPLCNRPLPKTNTEYWQKKIERTKLRDQIYDRELTQSGWIVLRIWEHSLKKQNLAKVFFDEIRFLLL